MNFLSHYYFERENHTSHEVTGTILPDLFKNTDKSWNFHPEKDEALFENDPIQGQLLSGWKKHLLVDKLFHSSAFFNNHTAALREVLKPTLRGSAVRPSFVAHVGLELLLDHLLIENRKINIDNFYAHLENTDAHSLDVFMQKCGVVDTALFFDFFGRFKSARYLLSYQKIENIGYALQRICMRIWPDPLSTAEVAKLINTIHQYKTLVEPVYMEIFEEIKRSFD